MSRWSRSRSPQSRRPGALSLCALIVAGAALIAVAMAGTAHAEISLVVVPARWEQTVEPGHTYSYVVKVVNEAQEPADVRIFTRDFVVEPDGSFSYPEPGDTRWTAAKWVRLPKRRVEIPALDHAEFTYDVVVPDDAEPGGHYAMLFFETQSESERGVDVVGRVGAQLLLTVPGDVRRELVVTNIDTPLIAWGIDDTATVTVENVGNVHAIPSGYLQVWGGLPGRERHWQFDSKTLLPGSSHTFEVPLEGLPWLGRLKALSEMKYGATVTDLSQSASKSVGFLAFSWKIILILDIVLIGFDVVLFREWRRRKRHPAAAESQRTDPPRRRRIIGTAPQGGAVFGQPYRR